MHLGALVCEAESLTVPTKEINFCLGEVSQTIMLSEELTLSTVILVWGDTPDVLAPKTQRADAIKSELLHFENTRTTGRIK